MTTKQKILQILNSDEFTSGEKLAQMCGISRAAVNKAINSLRIDGYSIEAVTNKGYKILSKPDLIDEEKIKVIINELSENANEVFAFNTIDSTNTEAKRRCAAVGTFREAKGELTEGGRTLHRSLFVSSEQTAGRGRMGRVFSSPANSGVYFSLVFSPKKGVTNPAILTAAAAVAVSRSIDELYNLNEKSGTKIKWVNDIFLPDSDGNLKKICGILTEGIANFETRMIESAIVGIGINVRHGGFTGDLAKVAGCIEDIVESKSNVTRNEIVAHIISHLLKFYDEMENETAELSNSANSTTAMLQEYRKKSMLIGKTVQVNPAAGIQGKTYKAKVIDISESAELIVEIENGEKKYLTSGEVSLHSYDFV